MFIRQLRIVELVFRKKITNDYIKSIYQ